MVCSKPPDADYSPNRAYFLADSAKSTVLEIYENPAAPVPDYRSIAPLTLHIAFKVNNIEHEVARLVAAGASVATAIDTNQCRWRSPDVSARSMACHDSTGAAAGCAVLG
jgi:hypothetical protein